MLAPHRFAEWLSKHEHRDKDGRMYRYHPRSNAHSVALCTFILVDFVECCSVLRDQAADGKVAYGIDVVHTWPDTGKRKTIDLAIGRPAHDLPAGVHDLGIAQAQAFHDVFVSCEAKTVMTEHGKSQPRVFDELGSSHEIVHQGRSDAIAAGISVVNIAETFVSPLRQTLPGELHVSRHKQPHAAERMIQHLRGLPIREAIGEAGFDAYTTIVVECDNQNTAVLWERPPAPQPGDPDHYETFLDRIGRFYADRFASLP